MLETFITDTYGGASAAPVAEAGLGSAIARRIFEALDTIEDDAGWNLIGGNAKGTTTGGPFYRGSGVYAMLRDRAEGRYLPYYEDEYDLRRLRQASRRLATVTSIVTGIAHALEVYCMQGEWRHDAKAADGVEAPQGLVETVQRIIDGNLERNDFIGGLDREIDAFAREEGETIVGIYPVRDGSGLSDWRRLDATALTEPKQTRALDNWLGVTSRRSWTFGVLTDYDPRQRRVDHTRRLGYHVVFDDSGRDWDFLPSWPQRHIESLEGKCGVLYRRNVPADAKRGLSDYLPIQIDLERESKLTENLSVGAAILAAIPWLEKMPKGTSSVDAEAAISMALNQWERSARSKSSGSNKKRLEAGQVPRIPDGVEYIAGPLGSVRQPIYIEVAQFLQRRCGQRFVMPEYMVSGDASNANYASTVEATSPFVKARENDQRQDEKCFEDLHWRGLRIAYDAGKFERFGLSWRALRRLIAIEVEGPEVASHDKAQVLAQATALYDRKLVDGSEVRQVLDYPHDDRYDGVTGSGVAQGPGPEGGSEPFAESRIREIQFGLLQEGA